MKIVTSFMGAVLLAGSLGASTAFSAVPGVISNQVLTKGSYCHDDWLRGQRPVGCFQPLRRSLTSRFGANFNILSEQQRFPQGRAATEECLQSVEHKEGNP
jgi:hypothetical protein